MQKEIHYSRWSVEKSAEIYEEVLGADWIAQQLWNRDAVFAKDKFARVNYYLDNHPVVTYWPWDAADSWRGQKILRVPQPLDYFFNTPAFHIQLASHLDGFRGRFNQNRLRSRTDFNSFAFECKMASSFHICGYDVEFFPEAFEPTPDLRISCKGGDVFAECKLREFTKQWREYETRAAALTLDLLHLMDRTESNLTLSIESSNALENLRSADLTLQLTQDLAMKNGSGSFKVDSCQVIWNDNGGFGVERDGVFPFSIPEAQPLFNGTVSGFRDGRPFYLNPRLVSFSTPKPIDRVTPLKNIFTKSLRQVEKYSPSIVYLELEPGTVNQVEKSGIDDDIHELFDPASPNYDKRTSALKYLIFTVLWWGLRDGNWTRYSQAHKIDNTNSPTDFPADFLRAGRFFPGNANADLIVEEIKRATDKGKPEKILELFDFGLAHSPDKRLFIEKARAYNALAKFPTALDASSEAIRLDPKDPVPWLCQAISFLGLKKQPEALNSVKCALTLDSSSVEAWCINAEIYLRMGKRNLAKQCLENARSLDSGDVRVRELSRKVD